MFVKKKPQGGKRACVCFCTILRMARVCTKVDTLVACQRVCVVCTVLFFFEEWLSIFFFFFVVRVVAPFRALLYLTSCMAQVVEI